MNQQRILVVEDERVVARDIAMQLQDLGLEVYGPVSTGELALEMAARLCPDLVLMDIHLDGAMDGIAAAQALRDQWGVPCIFMSAFGDNIDLLARAKLVEPMGYLEKPFGEHELRGVLARALEKS